VALSSVTLLPLFILQGVPVIDEAALRYLRVSTLLVFLLVGAGTLFIEITRRKFMTDLVLQNKRLDASAIHAQSANEAKTRFLANMSHELRTPLNHIIGFTEIVANERVGPLNLEQREYLDDVRTSSQHLLALVEDILDLSKVESGGTRFDPAWVDPVQLVDTTLGRIRVRAESEGVSIENDAREMPDRIWADPTRLTQILDNLLSNAVTYTPNGGQVVMSVRSDAGGDSPRVQFIVSDNGIGIDARDLERIFRPFERAVDPRSDLPGSGLGLALVKRLTELHAGTVHAESAGANMGSKFVVDIPAMPPAAGTEGVATEIET
jgi:two-component system cell cycle sensor histidine kinase PleC